MIPEAYKISFTLQSVFMNSQNMFVFAANPQGLVTTNVAPPVNVAPASTSTLGTENIVQTNDYGQPIFPEESTDPNQ
jgi:hypothetical protein